MTTRILTRILSLGTAAGLVLAAATAAQAANDHATLTGVVKNASGQPVAGAFVRVRNAADRLSFMVVSQAKGVFTASDLPAGQYTIQGVGGDYQSAISRPVSVSANTTEKYDVALSIERGVMLPPAWPYNIPQAQVDKTPKDPSALPAGDGKELVAEKCTVCHDVQRILVKRATEANWNYTVHSMRANMEAAGITPITDQEIDRIAKYLAANFKPLPGSGDINARLPRTLMTGQAMHYRVVTLDLPRHFSEPHDIAADPTGVAWAAERGVNALIRFDPKSYSFIEVPVPAGSAPPEGRRLGNPQINAQGILWTSDGPNRRWLSYDTKAYKSKNPQLAFHIYLWQAKGHGNAAGNSFALAPDGRIWGTGAGREVRVLDPKTAEFKFYPSPSAAKTPGAYGLAIAGDGSVWWAEDLADKMARLDPQTGKVEEFNIPYDGVAYPRRMNNDWDGNIWVGLWNAGKLMKIDYKTKKMTIYTPPTPIAGNYSVVADKKNHFIWVSEQQVDKIARFNPATGEWVEFPLSYAQQDPRRIEIDPTDPNRIFFSGNTADRIGYVEVLP
jgi:streptogramin lyase/mono/diheme cytochrome c family protein